ncbi:MAG TPA: PxKF domain-containing protein [Baekduia sp.]|nr:PxKF domain-containing protein [Baekduia sp.]
MPSSRFALATLTVCAAALAGAAAPAPAAMTLTNPGFETGTTAGWSGTGAVTSSYGSYTAPLGSSFAVVQSLTCPGQYLEQTFTAAAGDVLRGQAFFVTGDYWPFNDSGGVKVVVAAGGGETVLFSSSVAAVGASGGTPWTPFSYTAPASGTYTVHVRVDNVGDCSVASTVGLDLLEYDFDGFFQPVDAGDVLNAAKAGSAIPVKFSVGADHGLDIMGVGSPTSQPISCDAGAPVDAVEETVTAGSSSLSYDPVAGHYVYVWKSEKAWAGTCRRLTVALADGTAHTARFKFGK